jgi:hypothetical protein
VGKEVFFLFFFEGAEESKIKIFVFANILHYLSYVFCGHGFDFPIELFRGVDGFAVEGGDTIVESRVIGGLKAE